MSSQGPSSTWLGDDPLDGVVVVGLAGTLVDDVGPPWPPAADVGMAEPPGVAGVLAWVTAPAVVGVVVSAPVEGVAVSAPVEGVIEVASDGLGAPLLAAESVIGVVGVGAAPVATKGGRDGASDGLTPRAQTATCTT